MSLQADKQIKAIATTLKSIEQRVAQNGIGAAERTKLQSDLADIGSRIRQQEERLRSTGRNIGVGPELKCPETGESMGHFRLLDADVSLSEKGLWFGPGKLNRLLATYEERTSRSPTTSLEQIVLELNAEEEKQSARMAVRELDNRLDAVRRSIANANEQSAGDPHIQSIKAEIDELKKQAANMDLSAGPVAQPNITPHPGALVSLIRDGEQPCYLYAHDGSKAWLGRGSKCQIRIKDSRISRLHCVIISAGNNWYIADLDSRNGTYVNGERLTSPVRLSHNDTVNLAGAATMNFSVIAIAVNEEEFYSLALKELTNQATVEDSEELEDMLEQKAELRAEYEHLKLGAVVARSALPLMDAVEATEGALSEAGIARLDARVKETFRARPEDIQKQLAASQSSGRLSPRTGQPLTSLSVGEIEIETDLNPGVHRGGIFLNRNQLQSLLAKPQSGQKLADAMESALA